MPQMHLKQLGLSYSASGQLTKNKERIEKFMKTGNTDFIYRNDLHKACFQHDMAYDESKDLARRTQSDKVLVDKDFKTASNSKYDGYQRRLALMVYRFLDKKSSGNSVNFVPKYQFANELHKLNKNISEKKSLFFIWRQYLGCWFSWYATTGQKQNKTKTKTKPKKQKVIVCNWSF